MALTLTIQPTLVNLSARPTDKLDRTVQKCASCHAIQGTLIGMLDFVCQLVIIQCLAMSTEPKDSAFTTAIRIILTHMVMSRPTGLV